MKCFDLFCGGMSPKKIAEEMKVRGIVIHRLKSAKWPEDWDKGRKERVAKTVEIIQENALEKIESIRASNQRKYKNAMDLSLHLLAKKAANGTLDDKVAAEVLFKAGAEQEKAHLPLETVYGQKTTSAAVGAFVGKGGEVGVLAMLNERFERNHGKDDPEGP